MDTHTNDMRRRVFLQHAGTLGLLVALGRFAPAYARTDARSAALLSRPIADATGMVAGERGIDLTIDDLPLQVNGRVGHAIALNGTVPGPLIRLREGETAVLRVTNRLQEISSIHWHGLILPPDMDGVPGVSFGGIQPGETFTYRFPVRQSGTYWAHSHSGGQELLGLYFPLILDPLEPEPFHYDRDYVVMLSDWSFESPETIIRKLKKQAGYYNFQKRTLGDFFRDMKNNGWSATLKERLRWSKMRMDPTDFADVTGYTYTYLLNGLTPDANWTGVFRPGETVRLRCIDAGAMTYFDVRIPGLKMTVLQVDGQNVQPVEVDEFRIAPGETYDVLVQPADRAYTLFAEAMDRSGYTRGTLAPHLGMSAAMPPRRPRPLRTMADMGMDMSGMEGMDMPGMETKGKESPGMDIAGHQMHSMDTAEAVRAQVVTQRDAMQQHNMPGVETSGMAPGGLQGPSLPGSPPVLHSPDTHGPGNSSIAAAQAHSTHPPGAQMPAAPLASPVPTPPPSMGTPSHAPAAPHAGPSPAAEGTTTLPNLAERSGWPSPVADSASHGFLRFDLLEYQRDTDSLDALRWDMLGWFGGDYHRFWVKSEGRFAPREDSEVEVQALYGRLIAPFFDLQVGLRFDQRLQPGSDPTRVYAVIGLQGLAPYRFDIEPALFVSNKGKVSGRLTATYEVLLTQRLVLQPRLETNVAAQKDADLGSGAGLNDLELGLRLRYEIRREVAPYIGFTWKESFGETHDLIVREGAHPAHPALVAGVRIWF